ncbi:DUF2303 family protein [Pseudorhodobacter sp.]|uniref:DUF2303 family protein n=1 Tax=Pseudorhodobacter sp. TaxID=1934400 RepID=UPI00264946F0|nr:DUF2303 family protein [Pseudorhodobacter sp.]MDN5786523.1 YfdQ family protein [Pseudorhodobacter sp.]
MADTVNTPENPAQTMRDVMHNLGRMEVILPPVDFDLTSPQLITLPTGRSVKSLTEEYRSAFEYLKPSRRKGTARLSTLQSVIDWANRFKGDTSALFANPDQSTPSLTCIADYHAAGAAEYDADYGDSSARHCHHRAVYNFPLSKEWQRWKKVSGVAMDKAEIGQFIEDNAKDFIDPSPFLMNPSIKSETANWEVAFNEIAQKIKGRFGQYVKLLEMSRAFEVNESSNLKVTRNPVTGEQSIGFVNEHQDAEGKPISIPDLFIIAIPVFLSGDLYPLPIRFQYRKNGQTIKFTLTIYDPDRAFDDAFTGAVTMATEQTALPLFEGTPEA